MQAAEALFEHLWLMKFNIDMDILYVMKSI